MKTLTASEGKYYTNPDHSTMGKTIYLPDSVDETQFSEITEATYKKHQAANEKKAQEEINAWLKQQNADVQPVSEESESTNVEESDTTGEESGEPGDPENNQDKE